MADTHAAWQSDPGAATLLALFAAVGVACAAQMVQIVRYRHNWRSPQFAMLGLVGGAAFLRATFFLKVQLTTCWPVSAACLASRPRWLQQRLTHPL